MTDEDTSLFGQPDVTDKTDLDAHQVRLLIADFFGTGQPGDQLLLYYSGHGVKSLEEELYLCAANTTLGVRLDATAVSASYVHKRIQESSATAKVLVLDCCYAGAFKSADEQPWPRQGAGLFGLFSSGHSAKAKDAVRMGEPSPFTECLVDALRFADPDGGEHRFVSFDNIFFYMDDHLRARGHGRPVRMLLSPTTGTVALARVGRRGDGPAGTGIPGPASEPAGSAQPIEAPGSVIISDVAPPLAPVPNSAPRFTMGRYLVTNRQFSTFLASPPGQEWRPGGRKVRRYSDGHYLEHWRSDGLPEPGDLQYPVVNVMAEAAIAYLRWASERLGCPLRLPTVQEWNLAARAGRADPGWIEDELGNERVNYRGTSARLSGYAEFGSNPYGICDLLGNAYDLCLGSEPGLDGEQVLWACGGASWSPREELGRSLRMSWRSCRPDTGFRCVGPEPFRHKSAGDRL